MAPQGAPPGVYSIFFKFSAQNPAKVTFLFAVNESLSEGTDVTCFTKIPEYVHSPPLDSPTLNLAAGQNQSFEPALPVFLDTNDFLIGGLSRLRADTTFYPLVL